MKMRRSTTRACCVLKAISTRRPRRGSTSSASSPPMASGSSAASASISNSRGSGETRADAGATQRLRPGGNQQCAIRTSFHFANRKCYSDLQDQSQRLFPGRQRMQFPSWIELVERNVAKFGDLVAGIDPSLADIPEFFGHDGQWIERFVDFMIESIEGRVGFVKFQSAYFEACGLAGLAALAAGIRKARAAGIGVILDAKRGDIGATASAYARAYLTPASAGGSGDFEADCLTVNPLMGPDTLEPFVECPNRFGKGLFVLCRTSNPGAGWLQDKMTGNRPVSD